MSLTVGSLFSGIGGLDLGLERAGMNVIWQSEIDPYASRVLAKHWPEVPNHGNIKDIRWGDVVSPDVICGGYPCQPFSTAGKRQGTDDPRHLWPWVREAISELRPRYAILENVRGHVSLGLSTVLGEMASIGYDAEWQIVSAASVGAPHRRDRVIIVAYPNGRRQQECQPQAQQTTRTRCSCEQCANAIGQLANTDNSRHLHRQTQIFTTENWLNALSLIGSSGTDVADTDSGDATDGRQREAIQSQDTGWGNDRSGSRSDTRQVSMGSSGKASSDVANTDTRETSWGLGSVSTDTGQVRSERNYPRGEESHAGRQWWALEPDVGRVANGVPSRVDRLKGLGNAVVPQVAELVGRMVMEHSRTC
jgi:DNA (cytosine-5)-methyltransferase 1